MKTVCELLINKDQEINHIEPNQTAYQAMQLMLEKKIGVLPVTENGKMIGIISERDYPGKAKTLHKPIQDVLVKEIMSSHVVHVSPDDSIEHCIELVMKNRVRHLPVLRQEEIFGIISIGDLSRIRHPS